LDGVFFFGVAFLVAVLSNAVFWEVVFFVVSSSDEKEVMSLTPVGLDGVFFFGVVFLDAVLSDGFFLEVVFFGGSSTDDKDKLESSSSVVFFLVAVFFLLARVVLDAVVFVFFPPLWTCSRSPGFALYQPLLSPPLYSSKCLQTFF
jgi:hypothetical protein